MSSAHGFGAVSLPHCGCWGSTSTDSTELNFNCVTSFHRVSTAFSCQKIVEKWSKFSGPAQPVPMSVPDFGLGHSAWRCQQKWECPRPVFPVLCRWCGCDRSEKLCVCPAFECQPLQRWSLDSVDGSWLVSVHDYIYNMCTRFFLFSSLL